MVNPLIIRTGGKVGLLAIGFEEGNLLELAREDVEVLKEKLSTLNLNEITSLKDL